MGFVKLPVLFYGVVKNYQATVGFYIIRDLGLQGLFGINELSRHKFTINAAKSTCFQEKAGQIIVDVMFRDNKGVRAVSVSEEVTLPPLTSCDISVDIQNVGKEEISEGIIVPRKDIWKLGISAGRVLTTAKPRVITRVMNLSDQSLSLYEGEDFGKFRYTSGSPILISTVVDQNEYGECLLEGEEMEDPIAYEDFEEKKIEEVDFGLDNSNLSEIRKLEIRELLGKYKEVFQWDNCKVSFTNKIKHHITLKPGAMPVKHKSRKFSDEQNSFIEGEVKKLIDQNIVRPSQSSW